jgi:hypothetical protein
MMTLLLLACAAEARLSSEEAEPPEDLSAEVRKLLDGTCHRILDARGETVAEVWLRKEVPVKADDEQVKNGLTYDEVPQSTLLGAVRFGRAYTDYRKQRIREGVYTLRLGLQPADGDHAGTAPHREFALLSPAADDRKPGVMEVKDLREMSARSTGSHPGVMVLFPGGKDVREKPRVVDKGKGHWVLFLRLSARAGEARASLGLGLTVLGVSASR